MAVTAPVGLKMYQQQVDGLAKQWLEPGRDQTDPAPLKRVVTTLLASSVGDDALLLLGDWALQRGRVADARNYWGRISPALTVPRDKPDWLRATPGEPLAVAVSHLNSDQRWAELQASLDTAAKQIAGPGGPYAADTSVSLAAVRARLTLASLWQGQWERAEAELQLLERLHPEAEGWLGGSQGRFAETLRKLLTSAREWKAPPEPQDWPMIGKN